MSASKQIVLSLLVVLLAAGGWYAFSQRGALFGGGAAVATGESPSGPGRFGSGGGPGGVPVVTARAASDSSGSQIRAIGTLTAARAITIFPEVTGIVASVEAEPASTVAAGQLLVRLNDADQEVAVERAAIRVDDTRAALERAERLSRSNNITEVALSDARTAFRSAEIDLRAAELDRAKRNITAPFAGVVGLVPVSIGDLVTTSTALTTLDDVASLTVAFNAPERFAGLVRVGHPVAGTAIGAPGQQIRGEISAVDSRVDPATRVFKVEATLEEGIEGLKPGMSITVAVDFEGAPQTTVPSLAIQWDRQGSFVWAVSDNRVERTAVQILGRQTGVVMVAGDLAPGAEVVVEGLQRMREGVGVHRVDSEEAPPESAVSAGEEDEPSVAVPAAARGQAG